jgi:hypothetical protein
MMGSGLQGLGVGEVGVGVRPRPTVSSPDLTSQTNATVASGHAAKADVCE